MDSLIHHAYLSFLEPEFTFGLNNFTLRRFEHLTLGIDDSRSIIHEAYLRPEASKQSKIIFIIFKKITNEAVQALLKVLEEPPAQTTFFIITSDQKSLPLTLLSRLMIWQGVKQIGDSKNVTILARDFLNANPEARLGMVEQLTESSEEFLNAIESIILKKMNGNNRAFAISTIMLARKSLRESTIVPRLVWDHLGLALPELSKKV